MKINVFLSLTGADGIDLAIILKDQLERYVGPNDLKFECFLYFKDQKVGNPVVENYINQIDKSNFFVPILTHEYCKLDRIHVLNELERAKIREKYVYENSNHSFRFIFPYAPNDGEVLIKKIPIL